MLRPLARPVGSGGQCPSGRRRGSASGASTSRSRRESKIVIPSVTNSESNGSRGGFGEGYFEAQGVNNHSKKWQSNSSPTTPRLGAHAAAPTDPQDLGNPALLLERSRDSNRCQRRFAHYEGDRHFRRVRALAAARKPKVAENGQGQVSAGKEGDLPRFGGQSP
jgi:hypothetical protein